MEAAAFGPSIHVLIPMNPSTSARQRLDLLLPQWQGLLQGWAASGELVAAAREALRLEGESARLSALVGQWAAGEFSALPPIELLPASAMPGAAGAYAISTGTIYLNADWLEQATAAQAIAVLSEELGHHLDALANGLDTPGDEGELFAALLHGDGVISTQQSQRMLSDNDQGSVLLHGEALAVEQATISSTPIRASSPGRTSREYRNIYAFAALKADGSVVTWGGSGGDSSAVSARLASGVSQIFSTGSAFAALKADGSVVTWGDSGGDSSAVAALLASGVSQIFSTYDAFAALKADGSVVTWGSSGAGGDSSAKPASLASGVSQIFSTGSAFAALKADGSVVTWGSSYAGGDSSAVAVHLASGVSQIFSTDSAFAALKTDGSVVTWGGSGGDSSAVSERLASGVSQIFSADSAFAALKTDGSVVTWGTQDYGGDSSSVATRLASGVSQIFSTNSAFAALKVDGSVITWGIQNHGGDSSAVAARLASGVSQIFSTWGAFAALKTDGSVVTWGRGLGASFPSPGGDSSAVAARLASGVSQIFSTDRAFAALKADGSVVTWGDSGGDSSAVAAQLSSGVVGFANPFTDDRLLSFDVLPASVTLAVSPALVTETGATTLIYTFTRSGATNSALVVNYTAGGTATIGSDYTGISAAGSLKTVTFAVGAATTTVRVKPAVDATLEDDETVVLSLADGSGYSIGTSAAVVGTIRNSVLPVISLAVSQASVTENGTANLIYTFTRNGPTTTALSVNYTVAGTATLGTDYTGIATAGTTKTVSFAAGSATATVMVDPTADSSSEGNETVALTLSAGSGYTVGTTAAVVGTIRNVDPPRITLAVSPVSVTEDGTANLIYTFTRSRPTTAALIVYYTVAGTATLGTDYTGITSAGTTKTVSFAAGSATATVTVNPKADISAEANETVWLTLVAAGTG